MPQPAVERMSRVDTAWLRMDTEANLMMIVGVWSIRPGIRLADLRQRVAERLLQSLMAQDQASLLQQAQSTPEKRDWQRDCNLIARLEELN